jgi:hypothetical protein
MLGEPHDASSILGGFDMRGDDARAPPSRIRDTHSGLILGTRTSGVMPRPRCGTEGEGIVLQVDIDRLEPRRLGDRRDLDATHQAHDHGNANLVALQLSLQVLRSSARARLTWSLPSCQRQIALPGLPDF